MTEEEIKTVVDQLRKDCSDQGYFGIFKDDNRSAESFIKANKQGLICFATEILQAVNQVDQVIAQKSTSIISLDLKWTDQYCDTSIQYIEPVSGTPDDKRPMPEPESLKDKAFSYGCIAGMIFLIIATLIGVVTIVQWFF